VAFARLIAKDVSAITGSCRLSVVWRKLTQLNRVQGLRELSVPPGNRLQRLRGDRAGQYGIRINDQYRICFRWEEGYADDIEVTDYH
jgi:proteic killer suppression protein